MVLFFTRPVIEVLDSLPFTIKSKSLMKTKKSKQEYTKIHRNNGDQNFLIQLSSPFSTCLSIFPSISLICALESSFHSFFIDFLSSRNLLENWWFSRQYCLSFRSIVAREQCACEEYSHGKISPRKKTTPFFDVRELNHRTVNKHFINICMCCASTVLTLPKTDVITNTRIQMNWKILSKVFHESLKHGDCSHAANTHTKAAAKQKFPKGSRMLFNVFRFASERVKWKKQTPQRCMLVNST